jgi:hypothetical protein
MAAFTRLGSPAGISPAAPRSARRSMPEWRARGRLPLAAALTAVSSRAGQHGCGLRGVLPGPIQHFAHEYIGAPAPHHAVSSRVLAVASSRDAREPPAGHLYAAGEPRDGILGPASRHSWPRIAIADFRPIPPGKPRQLPPHPGRKREPEQQPER